MGNVRIEELLTQNPGDKPLLVTGHQLGMSTREASAPTARAPVELNAGHYPRIVWMEIPELIALEV